MNSTTFFGISYKSHYTISANFYLYLQYFQEKVFSFNKISGSQTNPRYPFCKDYFCQFILLFSLFLLLLIGSTALFGTIPIVLFRQTFIFIYNIFSKKFSVSTKSADLKWTLWYPLGKDYFCQPILLFSLFSLLFMDPLHFLVLFTSLTVPFQITFTFIYSTFSKKNSILVK